MNLWYQSRYTDDGLEPQTQTTPQGPGQRPDELLDIHEDELDELLENEPKHAREAPPAELLIPVEAGEARSDSYIGQDGIRHGAIVTQAPGETAAECTARLAAVIALMKEKWPAAA